MARMTKAKVRAVTMQALAKYAAKEADRSLLEGGESHDVDLQVVGKIGRQKVDETCQGRLLVGHDSTKASSSAVRPAKVIAWLLAMDAAPEKRMAQLRVMAKDGTLGESITADQEKQAEQLLKLFNQEGPSVAVKGTVRFEPAKAA